MEKALKAESAAKAAAESKAAADRECFQSHEKPSATANAFSFGFRAGAKLDRDRAALGAFPQLPPRGANIVIASRVCKHVLSRCVSWCACQWGLLAVRVGLPVRLLVPMDPVFTLAAATLVT
jgi:hypothetical protein